MAFELIKKHMMGNVLDDYQIRISTRQIRWGNKIREVFDKFDNLYGAEIYHDKENSLIKLVPSKNRLIAYSIIKNQMGLHSNVLMKWCGKNSLQGIYKGEIKKGEIIIDLRTKKEWVK